ncbi:hypothetical protein Nepgr_025391 [Nepenthes gracilis]|uniref:Uncharacterized protein n=1 Tax=Nepenthes gracilis TaxID=150966 RepID=A0AAD3XZM5_NEPGR|nr:hypothetical protein Nepgr_025391 [Nepenthes gracilis]
MLTPGYKASKEPNKQFRQKQYKISNLESGNPLFFPKETKNAEPSLLLHTGKNHTSTKVSNSDESVIPRPQVDIISSLPNSHEAVMDPLGRLSSADLVGERNEVLVSKEKDEVKTFFGSSLNSCPALGLALDRVLLSCSADSLGNAAADVQLILKVEALPD